LGPYFALTNHAPATSPARFSLAMPEAGLRSAQLFAIAIVYTLMKKVLLGFVGLVLLSQILKLWAHEHQAASVRQPAPPGIYKPHPGTGSGPAIC